MPDLNFVVSGVEPVFDGMTPFMQFVLDVENRGDGRVQSVILQTQIRAEPTRRSYSDAEKERLEELFGRPEQWGRSLQSMLWTHVSTTIPAFDGATQSRLPIPVTYDLNVAAAKYFYGVDEGEIPLLFLFSGTVFYADYDDRLSMSRISWERESRFRMPVHQWQDLMDTYYPGAAWLYLDRDVFEALYAFKRRHGLTSWNETVQRLLARTRVEAAI